MDYNARFYDSYITHFSQPDTIIPDQNNPQALNRYSYALNNPIRYNDPNGHGMCTDLPEPAQSACLAKLGIDNSGGLPPKPKAPIVIPVVPDQGLDGNWNNCGQYAYSVAWNYIYGSTYPLKPQDTVSNAKDNGWYKDEEPFTSPADMMQMAQYYADLYKTPYSPVSGNFSSQDPLKAQQFLDDMTSGGYPVIVDATITMKGFDVNNNGAHFVTVLSIDKDNQVTYADTYGGGPGRAGTNTVTWDVFWWVWINNSDGNLTDTSGSGWWMVP